MCGPDLELKILALICGLLWIKKRKSLGKSRWNLGQIKHTVIPYLNVHVRLPYPCASAIHFCILKELYT